MRFWVISPNVNGDGNTAKWIDLIEKEKKIFVGYGNKNRSGNAFENTIKEGDTFIISHGAMDNRKLHYAGKVLSKSEYCETENVFYRNVEIYLNKSELANHGITLNSCNATGYSKNPGTIYELKPENEYDKAVMEKLTAIFSDNGNANKETTIVKQEKGQDSVVLYTKTLGEILKIKPTEGNYNPLNEVLAIPDYQRIYCWSEKNVYQLLNDILENNDKSYHMGSVILHKTTRKIGTNEENGHQSATEENIFAIVDGQQRLVTLTLLLFELEPEIQIELLDEKFESTEAQNYIAYNKTLITNFVRKNRGRISVDKILEKLKFSVLTINDGSLDLAYTFFSNQNSRGKSLTDYDLLKAHHLRFITDEKHAKHLAERWDNIILNSDNNAIDQDLARTFETYLFRLRKWMRKREWSNEEKFKVKTEFEAAATIAEVPPFGEQFKFYESIQGGSHFFAYADHFIYKYKTYSLTNEYQALTKLSGETHGWYKDVIESLLFAYYLKFGTIYLSEALYCIERLISTHRYGLGRSSLRTVLRHAGDSEIIMMIDQATSPTFFLAESIRKIDRLPKLIELSGIRHRYKSTIKNVYEGLLQTMTIEKFKNALKIEINGN